MYLEGHQDAGRHPSAAMQKPYYLHSGSGLCILGVHSRIKTKMEKDIENTKRMEPSQKRSER